MSLDLKPQHKPLHKYAERIKDWIIWKQWQQDLILSYFVARIFPTSNCSSSHNLCTFPSKKRAALPLSPKSCQKKTLRFVNEWAWIDPSHSMLVLLFQCKQRLTLKQKEQNNWVAGNQLWETTRTCVALPVANILLPTASRLISMHL